MEYRKVWVEVAARFSAQGGVMPEAVVWEDGRVFPIERVKGAARAPARVNAVLPIRYLCTIGGRERAVYFEPNKLRWFVERPAREHF